MAKPTKAKLRKAFLEKRNRLSSALRARASAAIARRLFHRRDWKTARNVLSYASFGSEVETAKVVKRARAEKKRILLLPATARAKPVRLSIKIDLVLVPGVVFDLRGGRIGRGGGYFDKLLARVPKARRLGLAFSLQVGARPLPLEPHDIRMHAILTEKETIPIQ